MIVFPGDPPVSGAGVFAVPGEGVINVPVRNILVHQSAFGQVFGAELLTNGTMATWSGDNPPGWTVGGESGSNPEVTERDPNQGHAGTKTVGGAANLFSSATNSQPRLTQNVLTVGRLCEVNINMTNRVSGNIAVNGFVGLGANNFITVGNIRLIARVNAAGFVVLCGTAPTDITITPVSVKEITPGASIATPLSYTLTWRFGVPGAPSGQQEENLCYRMPSIGDELINGYALYLRRRSGNTNWDLRVDRFASSARTNKLNVANAGANTDGLRVNVNGDVHTIESHDAVTDIWTPRGSFTDSLYNTALVANVVYSSVLTPTLIELAA